MFELPFAVADFDQENDANVSPPLPGSQTTRRPTYRPTFEPTPYPIEYAIADTGRPTIPPLVNVVTPSPTSTRPQRPTASPFEFSDITQFNTGTTYTISDDASSFTDESIVVSQNSTMVVENEGYIVAPLNTDWPAVR